MGLLSVSSPHHHNQIQLAGFDTVLTKCFSNDPFGFVSVNRAREHFFARDYPKPGAYSFVARKKNLVVFICDIFRLNDMPETILAQQSLRSRKFGQYIRLRVLHGPWRGAH